MQTIQQFLPCATPQSWLELAVINQARLLIDHANCEKKAAATAMNLMYRYTQNPDLLSKMSQLAREELLHFQQVVEILAARQIPYVKMSPSRYAAGLRSLIRKSEQEALVDTLIVGAYIEARSCERFARLAPRLDAELERFYTGLLRSEERHFQDYLSLAEQYSHEDIGPRLDLFAVKEAELITSEDANFRFHSGTPLAES